MKVLVVGSGGREHALAWRLERDGVEVVLAPGNGGTARNVAIDVHDVPGLVALAQTEQIDLTIVGPEAPLAGGLVDAFEAAGLAVFGPTRAAARLEWSKAWTKEFLGRHRIRTAAADVVASEATARHVIAVRGLPLVLKADGLAGGKGVYVCLDQRDVETAFDHLFRARTFGAAAEQVLIEELLGGPELSVLAFADGERLAVMPPARDYKRLLDGDLGPNTGGMGGMTWPTYASPAVLDEIREQVLEPTLAGMAREGEPYRGVLYAGLMLTADGPKLLEFNCRFGDPECQLLMPLLESSLVEACASVAQRRLRPETIRWAERRAYGVVLAAPGYPEAPRLGEPITGLEEFAAGDDGGRRGVQVFHAGTRLTDSGVVTAGGRVLTLVGSDLREVYRGAQAIDFEGKQFRGDIGRDEAAETSTSENSRVAVTP